MRTPQSVIVVYDDGSRETFYQPQEPDHGELSVTITGRFRKARPAETGSDFLLQHEHEVPTGRVNLEITARNVRMEIER